MSKNKCIFLWINLSTFTASLLLPLLFKVNTCCHPWCLLWFRTSLHQPSPLSLLMSLPSYWLSSIRVYEHSQGSCIFKKIFPHPLLLFWLLPSQSYQNQGPTLRVIYTHYLYFSKSNEALNLPPLPKTYHKQCFSITDSQSKGPFL